MNEKIEQIRRAISDLDSDEAKAVRKGRARIVQDSAQALCKIFLELGPCFAVTIGYTVPSEKQGESETTFAFGFSSPQFGAAHSVALAKQLSQHGGALLEELERLREANRDPSVGGGPGGGDESDGGEPGGAAG